MEPSPKGNLPLEVSSFVGREEEMIEVRRSLAESRIIPEHPAGLTPREVEVLRLVASGMSSARVAEEVFLSVRTVDTHLTSIYRKLGVSSRAGATQFALEQGLA